MQHDHSITIHRINVLLAAAKRFRDEEELCHAWGYVYMFKGEWVGWSADYPEPHRWCPGLIAISPGGAIYMLVGGNDHDGASDLFLVHPGSDSDGFVGDSACSSTV